MSRVLYTLVMFKVNAHAFENTEEAYGAQTSQVPLHGQCPLETRTLAEGELLLKRSTAITLQELGARESKQALLEQFQKIILQYA